MRLGDITLGLWGWEGIKLYFPPHTLQTSLFSVKLFWETSYRKVEQIIYAGPYFTFHCLCWGWGVKPSWTKMKHIPSSWPSRSISIDKLDLKRIFSEKNMIVWVLQDHWSYPTSHLCNQERHLRLVRQDREREGRSKGNLSDGGLSKGWSGDPVWLYAVKGLDGVWPKTK